MAVYDNLPVYKAAYDLLRSVYEKTGKIPRDVKYTLVEVLKKDLTEIMVMIYRANATTGKLPYIERGKRSGCRSQGPFKTVARYAAYQCEAVCGVCQQVELLSKQLSAWHDYARRQDEKSQEKI